MDADIAKKIKINDIGSTSSEGSLIPKNKEVLFIKSILQRLSGEVKTVKKGTTLAREKISESPLNKFKQNK